MTILVNVAETPASPGNIVQKLLPIAIGEENNEFQQQSQETSYLYTSGTKVIAS